MSLHILIWTAILSLAPISELRGAIPFAVGNGINPLFAYFYAVLFNALIAPLVFIFLNTFHKVFSKMDWYTRLFNRFVLKTRTKLEGKINKYGYWGIALFVAIPLPITGAWTGTFGAWIFGLKKRKTIAAVLLGVSIAGLIISMITYFGIEAFSFILKKF